MQDLRLSCPGHHELGGHRYEESVLHHTRYGRYLLRQTGRILDPVECAVQNVVAFRGQVRLPCGVGAEGDLGAQPADLVEDDLLAALDSDQLSGACLDVFETEPLPTDHPFWDHPRIKLTPHISSITYSRAVAPQIIDNYRRSQAGQPLLNVVDRDRGY